MSVVPPHKMESGIISIVQTPLTNLLTSCIANKYDTVCPKLNTPTVRLT